MDEHFTLDNYYLYSQLINIQHILLACVLWLHKDASIKNGFSNHLACMLITLQLPILPAPTDL